MSKSSEMILAVRNEELLAYGPHFRALVIADGASKISGSLAIGGIITAIERGCWFGPRDELESNEAFRQVVTYTVLRNAAGYVATYKRTKNSTEERLRGQISIGFGGHVKLGDCAYSGPWEISRTELWDVMTACHAAAQREVEEEVVLPDVIPRGVGGHYTRKHIGWIVNNTDPVGRVHLGYVEIWDLNEGIGEALKLRESRLSDLLFVEPKEMIHVHRDNGGLESWSAILMDALYPRIEVPAPKKPQMCKYIPARYEAGEWMAEVWVPMTEKELKEHYSTGSYLRDP